MGKGFGDHGLCFISSEERSSCRMILGGRCPQTKRLHRRVTAVRLSASVYTKAALQGASLHVSSEVLAVHIIFDLVLWIIVFEQCSHNPACVIHGSAHRFALLTQPMFSHLESSSARSSFSIHLFEELLVSGLLLLSVLSRLLLCSPQLFGDSNVAWSQLLGFLQVFNGLLIVLEP